VITLYRLAVHKWRDDMSTQQAVAAPIILALLCVAFYIGGCVASGDDSGFLLDFLRSTLEAIDGPQMETAI